jgi:Carboxypeptidase regulatory-like domain
MMNSDFMAASIFDNDLNTIMKHQLKYAMVIGLFLMIQANAQTGTVKGRVKEQNGKALEGVLIRATSANDKDVSHETRSDSKGDFEFIGLQPGDYSFTFEKQGFKTFSTRKLELGTRDTLKLSRGIELKRENDPFSVIRGAVLYDAGFTLPNASVTIERIDGGKKFKQETVSREGGEFAFRVKSEKARYRISASSRGFQPASIEIDIVGDELRSVVVTLQKEKE